MDCQIDTTFDMRSDTPAGKDPDTFSPTLRRYHRCLWSKPLSDGTMFELDDTGPRTRYLHHRSAAGEFFLASDTIIHTYSYWLKMRPITDQIPEDEKEAFRGVGYTIGGMTVFPGNSIDGKRTINGARGMSPRIADRFDLTLEAIRRHYVGESSPLGDVLARHGDFFRLFGDFAGYVDFFRFDDLVGADGKIQFLLPFDDFHGSPLPRTVEQYREYRDRSVEFVVARNARLAADAR